MLHYDPTADMDFSLDSDQKPSVQPASQPVEGQQAQGAIARLLKDFVKSYADANGQPIPARLKYVPYLEGAEDFAGYLEQHFGLAAHPPAEPRCPKCGRDD